MQKHARELVIGDILAPRPVRTPRAIPAEGGGETLENVEMIPGGEIEDLRPSTGAFPITIAVKIGGAWQALPLEGAFVVTDG